MNQAQLKLAQDKATEALKQAEAIHTLAKAELSKASSAYKKSGKAVQDALMTAYKLSLEKAS